LAKTLAARCGCHSRHLPHLCKTKQIGWLRVAPKVGPSLNFASQKPVFGAQIYLFFNSADQIRVFDPQILIFSKK
jgi:hypothetical protein